MQFRHTAIRALIAITFLAASATGFADEAFEVRLQAYQIELTTLSALAAGYKEIDYTCKNVTELKSQVDRNFQSIEDEIKGIQAEEVTEFEQDAAKIKNPAPTINNPFHITRIGEQWSAYLEESRKKKLEKLKDPRLRKLKGEFYKLQSKVHKLVARSC